jgi:hypothetical protein
MSPFFSPRPGIDNGSCNSNNKQIAQLWSHGIQARDASSIIIGVEAMKHSRVSGSTAPAKRPLSFSEFVHNRIDLREYIGLYDRPLRFSVFLRLAVTNTLFLAIALLFVGLLLTAVLGPASLLLSSYQFNFTDVWGIIAIAFALGSFASWVSALFVGGLIMVPLWLWRLGNRLDQKRAEETMPKRWLWDNWIDGPEPK